MIIKVSRSCCDPLVFLKLAKIDLSFPISGPRVGVCLTKTYIWYFECNFNKNYTFIRQNTTDLATKTYKPNRKLTPFSLITVTCCTCSPLLWTSVRILHLYCIHIRQGQTQFGWAVGLSECVEWILNFVQEMGVRTDLQSCWFHPTNSLSEFLDL